MSYLEKLKSVGIEVTLSGDGLEVVGQLTDPQRKWIYDHEQVLLREIFHSDATKEAEARGILLKGTRQKIKHVCCLDCAFDKAEGPRCRAGVQRSHREHKIRLCLYYAEHPADLTSEQESSIRAWLAHIGETHDYEIRKVLAKCQGNADALVYFLGRAEEVRRT